MSFNWENVGGLESHSYTCGYCGRPLASEKGWRSRLPQGHVTGFIYVCHQCQRPTFFDKMNGSQVPGVTFGNPVSDIPEKDVETLYDEARNTTGAGAYTAAVLCCRKLLMHIAVSKGATAGKSFLDYVLFLADKNYVPPDAKGWVDHIRTKGNEANHEILLMKKEDAEDLLSFIEMLLKVIYEFPAAIKKKTPAP